MTSTDRRTRAFPRYEVSATVDYTGTEVVLYHQIQNISLGGICISAPAVEPIGSQVDLVINFPDLKTSLSMRGEVVWANRDPPMDMGIRFLDLDEQKRETLRQYVNAVKKSV
jgi:uncharacterized protein (TIGR02266 family)